MKRKGIKKVSREGQNTTAGLTPIKWRSEVVSSSTARRKGLTIMMSRRMKHTYPAIQLATSSDLDLNGLISHHRALEKTAEAFATNARYETGVYKIIIDV